MECEDLRSKFNKASKSLANASGKSAGGIEKAYGQAYQAMVKAGCAPQLKKKYRKS